LRHAAAFARCVSEDHGIRKGFISAFSLPESTVWLSVGGAMLEEVLLFYQRSKGRVGQVQPRQTAGLCARGRS
jgi:hypothetical protein